MVHTFKVGAHVRQRVFPKLIREALAVRGNGMKNSKRETSYLADKKPARSEIGV